MSFNPINSQLFGDDHEKQYIYKEPKVTTLAELTLRLQKLYSRKFASKEIVHIIHESGKVQKLINILLHGCLTIKNFHENIHTI